MKKLFILLIVCCVVFAGCSGSADEGHTDNGNINENLYGTPYDINTNMVLIDEYDSFECFSSRFEVTKIWCELDDETSSFLESEESLPTIYDGETKICNVKSKTPLNYYPRIFMECSIGKGFDILDVILYSEPGYTSSQRTFNFADAIPNNEYGYERKTKVSYDVLYDFLFNSKQLMFTLHRGEDVKYTVELKDQLPPEPQTVDINTKMTFVLDCYFDDFIEKELILLRISNGLNELEYEGNIEVRAKGNIGDIRVKYDEIKSLDIINKIPFKYSPDTLSVQLRVTHSDILIFYSEPGYITDKKVFTNKDGQRYESDDTYNMLKVSYDTLYDFLYNSKELVITYKETNTNGKLSSCYIVELKE